jgi:lia operon protein LiaF
MNNRKIIIGPILILLGLILLTRTLDLFYFSFGEFIGFVFPLALVILGLWLISKGRRRPTPDHFQQAAQPTPSGQETGGAGATPPGSFAESPGMGDRTPEPPQPGPPGKIKYGRFIGDMYVDCNGVDLQDIEINNFLGDVEVKLHGGKLGPGLNRMVISGFIGDVRVLVPQEMPVFAQSSNFIGDIEIMGRRSAGFGNNLDAQTPNYSQAQSKLYIASNHFIGDVRVYVV